MSDLLINCPHCKESFPFDKALAAPLLKEREAEMRAEIQKKEKEIREREAVVNRAQETVDQRIAETLKIERAKITADAEKHIKLLMADDLEEKARENAMLQKTLEEKSKKLAAAQNAQADLLKMQLELDDAKREMNLTIEKKVMEASEQIRQKALKDAGEQLALREAQERLKLAEKEKTIIGLQSKLQEALRKAEQGSQQLQGEVQEDALEEKLRAEFIHDDIVPVPKGKRGADALQRVLSPDRQKYGSILWESKRTKTWSDGWLAKLREDQREAMADIAVIVSQALPEGVTRFTMVDRVWVVSADWHTVAALAAALRHTLIEVARARRAADGQQTKMEQLYRYFSGPDFQRRVEAIVENFSEMQADLEKERRDMQKSWAKREKQLRMMVDSTSLLQGELQGIIGGVTPALGEPETKLLDLPVT